MHVVPAGGRGAGQLFISWRQFLTAHLFDRKWEANDRRGGSIDPSTLDGAALQYVYCASLFTTVYVSNPYAQTSVNKAGIIYDLNGPGTGPAMVPNAGQVAWLLTTYGTAGQGTPSGGSPGGYLERDKHG